MTKIFYQGLDRRVGKVVARLSRKDMTLFIHAITGHNNLNCMKCIIIPDYTPLWFCEEEDESFQHLYEDCPVFWKQRMEIQEDRIGTENWTVQTVLRMTKIEDILEALQTNNHRRKDEENMNRSSIDIVLCKPTDLTGLMTLGYARWGVTWLGHRAG